MSSQSTNFKVGDIVFFAPKSDFSLMVTIEKFLPDGRVRVSDHMDCIWTVSCDSLFKEGRGTIM